MKKTQKPPFSKASVLKIEKKTQRLPNCRADEKTCRGHVFRPDRSGYAARTSLFGKRFISWRTEVRGGRP